MLIYDHEIFNKYKAMAVTELEIGKTYYSNSYPEQFVVKKIYNDDIGTWFVTDKSRSYSCSDRNIGKSYNPWLVFSDKKTKDACLAELVITFDRSDNDFDDYFDDNVFDYLTT